MVMTFFGNHTSKCNRLSKNIRPIQHIKVLHRLRNKQKHYLIYYETPCSFMVAGREIGETDTRYTKGLGVSDKRMMGRIFG